jgi:hypothetical protein
MLDGRKLRLDFTGPRESIEENVEQDQQKKNTQNQTDNKSKVSDGSADDDAENMNTDQTADNEVSSIDYNTSYLMETDNRNNAMMRALIKLYVLADKLIDTQNANLVIDKLIRHMDARTRLPGPIFINIVYQCTPSGSPLRNLFCDWYVYEASYTWCQRQFADNRDLPIDFLKDFIVETGRVHEVFEGSRIVNVFNSKAIGRPPGYYHQKSGNI